jgi:hypothetical protein
LHKVALEEEKKKHLEIDAETWRVVCDLQYQVPFLKLLAQEGARQGNAD